MKVKLHLQESILGFTPFDLVSQCLGNKVTLSVTIVLIALSLYRLSSFLLTLKSPIKSNGAVIHPKLPLFLQREIQAKSVQIVLSKHSRVSPYAEGIINKRIVLPSNIFKILKTQEVHAVLIHELAHLNIATQMLHFFTCAVNALFIFVPLKRIQLSLEQLCDSKILSTPLHPFSLATALGKVARSCRKAPVNKLALYSKFHLLTRIKALCLPPPKKMSHLLIFLWGLLALYFLLFLAMSQIGHF